MEKVKNNIIPPMTHPYGRAWEQPDVSEIIIDDNFATMDKKSFDKIKDYSRSQPTGVYEGKMWKTSDNKIVWHLHWWSASENPDMCSGNVREIKIIEKEVVKSVKNITDIRSAVREYLMLPTHTQIGFWRKLGYEGEYNLKISIHENDMMFVKWVKDNDKQKSFITILNEIINEE